MYKYLDFIDIEVLGYVYFFGPTVSFYNHEKDVHFYVDSRETCLLIYKMYYCIRLVKKILPTNLAGLLMGKIPYHVIAYKVPIFYVKIFHIYTKTHYLFVL